MPAYPLIPQGNQRVHLRQRLGLHQLVYLLPFHLVAWMRGLLRPLPQRYQWNRQVHKLVFAHWH